MTILAVRWIHSAESVAFWFRRQIARACTVHELNQSPLDPRGTCNEAR